MINVFNGSGVFRLDVLITVGGCVAIYIYIIVIIILRVCVYNTLNANETLCVLFVIISVINLSSP